MFRNFREIFKYFKVKYFTVHLQLRFKDRQTGTRNALRNKRACTGRRLIIKSQVAFTAAKQPAVSGDAESTRIRWVYCLPKTPGRTLLSILSINVSIKSTPSDSFLVLYKNHNSNNNNKSFVIAFALCWITRISETFYCIY